MKKQVDFLSGSVFLCVCRLGCNLMLAVIILSVSVFLAEDVFAQNQPAKPKKDSKNDSLRPKVEFVATVSRSPFYNYLKGEMQNVVKVEEERVVAAPNLNIQGLIWGGRLPVAIIENSVLKVGDVINGYKVDKIDKNGVVLSASGTSFRIGPPSLTQLNNVAKIQEGGKDAK